MKLNLKISQSLRDRVLAQDMDCFRNSVMAAVALGPDAVYVEGYVIAVSGHMAIPLVIHHGWVEHDTEIIDPTPIYCNGKTQRRYFPALRYLWRDIHKRIARSQTLPFSGEMTLAKHPESRLAYLQASKLMYGDSFEDAATILRWTEWPEWETVSS